jgi:predicted GIY-YIG superfamily endonuclease
MPMKFYVYILQSLYDSSYYIGYSKNLDSRLEKHNTANTGYSPRTSPVLFIAPPSCFPAFPDGALLWIPFP